MAAATIQFTVTPRLAAGQFTRRSAAAGRRPFSSLSLLVRKRCGKGMFSTSNAKIAAVREGDDTRRIRWHRNLQLHRVILKLPGALRRRKPFLVRRKLESSRRQREARCAVHGSPARWR